MYHSPIQLDVFPTSMQMRRIDPAHNMRRFYRLSVQPDLFGGATLVREWGRIGLRGHQTQPVTEKRRPIRLRIGLFGSDGAVLSNLEEREFGETSEDPRRRETTVRLILAKAADVHNDKDVRLVLTRIGDGPERPYRTNVPAETVRNRGFRPVRGV